eukprot:3503894-Prorocentrum_lima.AAC.1
MTSFAHKTYFDELNRERYWQWQPCIQYEHIRPLFIGVFVTIKSLKLLTLEEAQTIICCINILARIHAA